MVGHIRRTAVASAGFVLAVAAFVAAAPASMAASGDYIATPNGMEGVQQTLVVKAPDQKGKKIGVTVSNAAFGAKATYHTTVNSHGYGSLNWTPWKAGTWTLAGTGAISSIPKATISVVSPAAYVIAGPVHLAQTGVPTTMYAQVITLAGWAPGPGNAEVVDASSNVLGATPFGSTLPDAEVAWTPTAAGTINVQAAFSPPASASGTPPVASHPCAVTVTDDPVVVAIQSAATCADSLHSNNNTDGAFSSRFVAVVAAGYSPGTITWQVDDRAPYTPVGSELSYPFMVELSDGPHTISVTYTGTAPDGVTPVTASDSVTGIGGNPPEGTVKVGPQGKSPWSTTKTVSMKLNSTIKLAASSTSGARVLLSESGPCVLAGATLRPTNTGTCTVRAMDPGSQTYQGSTQTYTVKITD